MKVVKVVKVVKPRHMSVSRGSLKSMYIEKLTDRFSGLTGFTGLTTFTTLTVSPLVPGYAFEQVCYTGSTWCDGFWNLNTSKPSA